MAQFVPPTFHPFPFLPKELRLKIWQAALPHRVVEHDEPYGDLALATENDERELPRCNFRHTTWANSRPPILSQVCTEARAVSFETGSRIPNPAAAPETRPHTVTMIGNSRFGQWFDPPRDTLHMHVDSDYYLEDRSFIDGNPVPHFLGLARTARHVSMGAELARHDEWRTERLVVASGIQECLDCMEIVSLHAPLQAAIDDNTGLFDLDTRIRLVEAGNHREIDRYRAFFKAHGSRQDFRTAEFFERYVDDSSIIGGAWTVAQWVSLIDWSCLRVLESDLETSPSALGFSSDGIWIERDEDDEIAVPEPNFDHPWVQAAMLRRPRHVPVIMMRLCVQDCYSGLQCVPRHENNGAGWWKAT